MYLSLKLTFHPRYISMAIPFSVNLFAELMYFRENLKYERKITLPVPTRSNIFGVPLEELMGYDGEKGGIPRVVRDSIQFLRETGSFSIINQAGDTLINHVNL